MATQATSAGGLPRRLQPLGAIVEGGIYTVAEFKERVGWSEATLRSARHNGLRVYRRGRNGFIHGADFLDWLRGSETETKK